jgi:hypothetical protein
MMRALDNVEFALAQSTPRLAHDTQAMSHQALLGVFGWRSQKPSTQHKRRTRMKKAEA